MRGGFGGQLLDALFGRFDAMQAGMGELTVLRVGPDGLAQLGGVGRQVEQVVDDYDFTASLLRVTDAPATAPSVRPTRALPLVGIDTSSAGSFGR